MDTGQPRAGNRPAAVGPDLLARLRPVVMATERSGLVFTAPGVAHLDDCKRKRCPGCKVSQLHYSNWLRRVWKRALTVDVPVEPEPRRPGQRGPLKRAVRREHYLAVPQPTPHDCRHSYGTDLADEGVPPHDIAKLMGHADERSTRRYIHSGDERFGKALAALDRARGRKPAEDHPVSVPHDLRGGSQEAAS